MGPKIGFARLHVRTKFSGAYDRPLVATLDVQHTCIHLGAKKLPYR